MRKSLFKQNNSAFDYMISIYLTNRAFSDFVRLSILYNKPRCSILTY